jgi:phenylacetate-CoA ligase
MDASSSMGDHDGSAQRGPDSRSLFSIHQQATQARAPADRGSSRRDTRARYTAMRDVASMRTIARLLRRGGRRVSRDGDSGDPAWDVQSAIPGAIWPAVAPASTAATLALLYQLDRSQWLAPDALVAQQLRQLDAVLRQAHATVPYYRERWSGRYLPDVELTATRFARLPILTRRDLQEHFDALRSRDVPTTHGAPSEQLTSGSTGSPVRSLATPLVALFWNAFTLRDHAWHRRDLTGKLAVMRSGVETKEHDSWGPATVGLATGRSAGMSAHADVAEQLEWLERQQPAYLLTYPSIVVELAKLSLRRGVRLAGLREVRTFAEALAPDARALSRRAWDVPLTDLYSTTETGYIALQCPESEQYHVQSEGVLLEILDDDGAPCPPGRVGRVVLTTLQNFAMPLVRYEVGDYAEPGEPCPCGRGLPVLRRILGRVRNMLVTADGRRSWPMFGTRKLVEIAPVRQHQLVQKAYDLIEVKLVIARPVTPDEEERMRRLILSLMPSGMRLHFSYVDDIPRNPGGKFEDFVSEVAAASR